MLTGSFELVPHDVHLLLCHVLFQSDKNVSQPETYNHRQLIAWHAELYDSVPLLLVCWNNAGVLLTCMPFPRNNKSLTSLLTDKS